MCTQISLELQSFFTHLCLASKKIRYSHRSIEYWLVCLLPFTKYSASVCVYVPKDPHTWHSFWLRIVIVKIDMLTMKPRLKIPFIHFTRYFRPVQYPEIHTCDGYKREKGCSALFHEKPTQCTWLVSIVGI